MEMATAAATAAVALDPAALQPTSAAVRWRRIGYGRSWDAVSGAASVVAQSPAELVTCCGRIGIRCPSAPTVATIAAAATAESAAAWPATSTSVQRPSPAFAQGSLSEWLHWLSNAPVTDCSDGAPVYFNNFLFSSWYIDSKCMFLYIKEKTTENNNPRLILRFFVAKH